MQDSIPVEVSNKMDIALQFSICNYTFVNVQIGSLLLTVVL